MGYRHGPGPQHMMDYGNYSFFWIAIMGVLLLIILFLLYKLVRKNKYVPTDVETSDTAVTILKERYARGELTDAEFTQKKEMLNNNKYN
ncbi:SHOCT domain-containing protein [Sporosarcina sp. FA9]|uniref:SHOCT domain-containing protein n=1 Tax=Sporosarcina sp. FA9 TaxID=3413030 RepID=UPI003F656911